MEVTREQYAAIEDNAHDLHEQIHGLMEAIKAAAGPGLTGEWHELHDLLRLVSVITAQAARYRDRAELPADPIDLTVADAVDGALEAWTW